MASETDPIVKKDEAKAREQCFGRNVLDCCFTCWHEPCFEDPAKATSQRDAFWDNWKGFLILLVILMHIIGIGAFLSLKNGYAMEYHMSLPGSFARGLMYWSFFIAMPSFSFITGYFSTATPGTKQLLNQMRYSLAWFISHCFFFSLVAYSKYTERRNTWLAEHPHLNETNAELRSQGQPELRPPGILPISFFGALGPDWYLWTVIIWRFVLPALDMIERKQLLSFVLAAFMSFTDVFHSTYSLAPFTFLPFFVAGYRFKEFVREEPEQFLALRTSLQRRIGLVCITVIIIGGTMSRKDMGFHFSAALACLYGGGLANQFPDTPEKYVEQMEQNYTKIFANPKPTLPPQDQFCHSPGGVVYVIVFYATAFIFISLIMSVIPGNELPIVTKAGKNSLYIYLAHTFFASIPAFILTMVIANQGIIFPPWLSTIFILVLIVGFWACLAQQWVRCCCQPCIEPDVETCCVKRPKQAAPTPATMASG